MAPESQKQLQRRCMVLLVTVGKDVSSCRLNVFSENALSRRNDCRHILWTVQCTTLLSNWCMHSC